MGAEHMGCSLHHQHRSGRLGPDERANPRCHCIELKGFATAFDHPEVALGHRLGNRQFLGLIKKRSRTEFSVHLVD